MKSRYYRYLLVPVVGALAACSSTPQYEFKTDTAYVQKVETAAKYSSGAARVYWVNPPKKRVQLPENTQD